MNAEGNHATCRECGAALDPTEDPSCPVCGAAYVPPAPDTAEREDTAYAPLPSEERDGWSPADEDPDGPRLVCCVREAKINPLAAGPLVEAYCGLQKREAMMQAAQGMGILAEGIAADTAENMIEALAEEGVEAFAFPASMLPEVVRQVDIGRIYDASDDALHVQVDREGTVKSISWSRIAAGYCTQEKFGGKVVKERIDSGPTLYYARGGVGRITTGPRYRRRREEAGLMVTLVLRDAEGRAYTMPFNERKVRYAYLGDRAKPTSRLNLALLLGDVMQWAGHAFFPEGFRAVARGDSQQVTKITGRLAADNYRKWVLCMAAQRGLFRRA